MGCCSSRESRPSSSNPYASASNPTDPVAPDASTRNITASSPPHGASPRISHASQHQHLVPVSARAPNAPLKPLDPSRRSRLPNSLGSPTTSSSRRHRVTPLSNPNSSRWTRKRLDSERADWWDTRVHGKADVWGALRLVVEQLQAGDTASAQVLLDAVGCTCPTGEVCGSAGGIYDSTGEAYGIPDWLVLEPEGLEEEDGEEEEEEDDDDDDDVKAGWEEVGGEEKATGEKVRVRCRLSSTGRDVVVETWTGERVGVLARKLNAVTELQQKRIRLYYLGHELSPSAPFDTVPWKPGHVITVGVFD